MMSKTNIKLELCDDERKNLRKNKIKKSEFLEYAYNELAILLNVPKDRVKEVYLFAYFQQIQSIGIEFTKDLVF